LQGSGGGSITDHPEAWVSLSRFISQLSGLQDLVWAYESHIPQSVLSVVSARGCRLHMHCFHLSSLVQQRDNPQPIDPNDYALSPHHVCIASSFVWLTLRPTVC
jgi:hypothetical protein